MKPIPWNYPNDDNIIDDIFGARDEIISNIKKNLDTTDTILSSLSDCNSQSKPIE